MTCEPIVPSLLELLEEVDEVFVIVRPVPLQCYILYAISTGRLLTNRRRTLLLAVGQHERYLHHSQALFGSLV